MQDATFLFTDIEGSTRLWEEQPERMRPALAAHDAMLRDVVERHRGRVVKMTGDGVHAVFGDALDAVQAALAIQLSAPSLAPDIELRLRLGLHAGPAEGRDGDFYGNSVNRAARVMAAAHGGQALLSEAVAQRLDGRLPEGCELLDLGRVRLRDLSHGERLLQLRHPGLRADFPALRSLEDTPNNLPLDLTSFVGRVREVAKVRALLAGSRLVSIVGLGGLGKTRVALHAAVESMGDFPDGVWVVEMSALHDAAQVAEAIAAAVSVQADSGRSIDDSLARFMRDRRLLLVLDNCEHVLAGVASVARRLLSATPSVRVLATSREPLRIPGEALFPLSGLDIPGPREVLSPDRVSQFDSVRLFVERACAALPDFTLDGDNADLVAAICHRLDGIPLAIELAAARVRSAPLATIAARLKDRFRLLRSSDPTALPRQRTLAATIDWSHELLPADERVLFRRMAVFSGGCTLDSLELVCGDAGAEADALELVARLVEKSLVTFNDATGRYSLLDTVREYALGRLEESGELRESRERHFRHYVDMANASKAAMAGDDGAAVLGRLDAERENFLAAHQWAGVGGDPQAGMAMLNALKPYWWGHGLLRLAEGALTEALARPGAAPRTRARGQSLFIAGQLRSFMGRHDEALPLLEESLAIARELGDSRGISTVCQALGSAELAAGHFGLARAHLDEATTIARGAGEERALAAALSARVQLHRLERQTLEAATLAEECVRLGNSLGDAAVRANGLLNAAMISLDLGRGREARETARALAADAPGLRHLQTRAGMLDVALGLSAYAHEWARVALLWGAAEALAEETGYRRDAADEAFVASRLAEGRAELGARFEEAAARGRGLQVDESLARAIECIEAPVPAASTAGL